MDFALRIIPKFVSATHRTIAAGNLAKTKNPHCRKMLKVYFHLAALILAVHSSTAALDVCKGQPSGALLLHPLDCSRYIVCRNGRTAAIRRCPANMHFNRLISKCDNLYEAACDLAVIRTRQAFWDAENAADVDCQLCSSACNCILPPTPSPVTPDCPTEATPSTPGPSTPSPATPATPSTPGESTPGTPGESTPGSPGECNPGSPGASTPGAPCEGNPSTPGESTPGSPGESTPSTPGQGSPSTPGESTPSTPGESSPSTPGESTPSTPGESSPSTPGESSPSSPGESTPSSPGESSPGENTPSSPGESTPSTPGSPGEITPSTPSTPGENTPSTPSSTPATPSTPDLPGPSPGPAENSCRNNLTVCNGQPDGSLGYVSDNCYQYYVCVHNCAVTLECPNNLQLNLISKQCDYPQNVECPFAAPASPRPNAGPSGTTCSHPGKCANQPDGVTLSSSTNPNGYIVCQCECEIERPCPDGLVFNETLQSCLRG